MKPKIYPFLEECIQEGVLLGYRRAFKHLENPSEDQIIESLVNSVMLVIEEKFEFD